ncbi:MAG TPA: hypothetical protein DCF68_10840 [Cyanothece sp. UBA12306]|nr:hypothetical protein [Cyanothece sp. UBA12306]
MSEETPKIRENGLSQQELAVLLQQTLEQLEDIVKKLNTDSVDHLPTRSTVEPLVTSTQEIATLLEDRSISPRVSEVATNSEVEKPEAQPELVESPEIETLEAQPEVELNSPSLDSQTSWWDKILGNIRWILRSAIGDKGSNLAITAIIAAILVLVISSSVFLLPQILTTIKQSPSEPPQPKVVPTPPQLEAPAPSEPLEILPPPEPVFTPEQNLIAAIQQQVSDLTSQYPEELIGSIEANFPASRLIVTLGEQWYQLNTKKQDLLAQSIFKRSQGLDFRKLEIIDLQGQVIARSPVVGNQVIILRRQPSFNQ